MYLFLRGSSSGRFRDEGYTLRVSSISDEAEGGRYYGSFPRVRTRSSMLHREGQELRWNQEDSHSLEQERKMQIVH